MKIYFVRHAQSMGNLTGDYSTNIHDTLSDNGKKQSLILSERLKGLVFNKIYCSPLKRAFHTIKPYVLCNNLKAEIWPELAETCWQDDRSIIEDDTAKYKEYSFLKDEELDYFHFRDNKPLLPIEEETYSQGICRLESVVKLISSKTKDNDTILIVSHAFAISRLIELFLGLNPNGVFDFDNTGISLLETDKKEFKVSYINRL